MTELRERKDQIQYDIIGITESWANDGILDAELSIDGYTMYRKDRQ
jgi:hypothetical protein